MTKRTRDLLWALLVFACLGTLLGFQLRDFVPSVEGTAVSMSTGKNVRLLVKTTDGERSIAARDPDRSAARDLTGSVMSDSPSGVAGVDTSPARQSPCRTIQGSGACRDQLHE
jgi:hypothetical protein